MSVPFTCSEDGSKAKCQRMNLKAWSLGIISGSSELLEKKQRMKKMLVVLGWGRKDS